MQNMGPLKVLLASTGKRLGQAWVLALAVSSFSQQVALPRPDTATDLQQRHPEISTNADFRRWLAADGGIGPWYETLTTADQLRSVVIQNASGTRVFGALVSVSAAPVVRQVAQVDLAATGQTRAQAQQLSADKWAAPLVQVTRPVIDFLPDNKFRMGWEYEVIADGKIETYRLIDKKLELSGSRNRLEIAPGRSMGAGRSAIPGGRAGGGNVPPAPGAAAAAARAAAPDPPVPGDSADDDLHGQATFKAEALGWINGLTSVESKAKRINERVFATYAYDNTIKHIDVFTWADVLTRDVNSRKGICDEFAVVAVTYLRAVGIPSRVKLITWTDPTGKPDAHAAVEYFDAGTWHHMDPTWNKFHEPGAYRAAGMTNVLVMDTFDPLDSRSNVDAYGVPDVPGDHKLHPYFDYVIPAFPGKREPGYSF